MKLWNITLALLPVIAIFSCTKENETEDEIMVASLNTSELLITGWEGGYQWQKTDSADFYVFEHERAMSELTSSIFNKGVVLVALKNVPYKEDSLQTRPKLVPFSVIPYYGHDQQAKPACDQHWYIIPSTGKIVVKYRTNRHHFSDMPLLAPDGRVEAKYFLLPEAELKRLGHTQKTIQQISYETLIKLLGISG